MKTFKQALSITLAAMMLLSAVFIGATAEETTAIVNGTEIDFYRFYSTNNGAVGTPILREQFEAAEDSKPLIPELPSDRYTFTWDVEANSTQSESLEKFFENEAMSNETIYTLLETQAVSINTTLENATNLIDVSSADSGLMFYISLGETSKETVLYIESQCVGFNENGTIILESESKYKQYYGTTNTKDSPYYLLNAGTASWETKTITDKLGVGSKKDSYGITLPAGYEGFVYLPRDSFLYNRNLSIEEYKYFYRTDFYVNNLSSANTVEVSNIMLVDGNVAAADVLKVGDTDYNFAENCYFSFDALNVSGVEVSRDGLYGFDSANGQLAPTYGAENSYLNADVKGNYTGTLSPDSYYTVTPADFSKNPESDKRPTNNSKWSFFTMEKLEGNGNKRYAMNFTLPDPFSNGYDRDTMNTGVKMTYGEQYDAMFSEDGTAYIGGTYINVGWNNTNTTANSSTQATHVSINPVNYSTTDSIKDKALLFYIKHTYDEDITEKESMNLTVMLNYYFTQHGRPYYVYDKSGKWEEKAFVPVEKRGTLAAVAGCMELSPDFEGWVMIPVTSIRNYNSTLVWDKWQELRLSPENFGGKYGELIFGDITLVDDIDPRSVSNNSVFVSSNEIALSADFPFATANIADAKCEANSLYQKGNGGITGLSVVNQNMLATFTASNDFAPIDENGIYTASSLARLHYRVDGADPTTAGYSSFAIRVDNTNGGNLKAIVGTSYVYLDPGSAYYLMSDNNDTWEAKTTTTDTWTMKIGTTSITERSGVSAIEIPAGFVGWLCIPFESYRSSFTTMARFDFFPVTMTGSVSFNEFTLFSTVAPKYYVDSANKYVGMNANIPTLVPYSAADTKAVTIVDGVLTNESDALYAELKTEGSVNVGEALMFWAKNDSETDIAFNVAGFDHTSARVYRLNSFSWELTDPTVDNIVIPAGFEGWVRIAASEAADFTSLRFIFNTLADGFAMSDFMIANQAGNLDFMRRGTTYKTPLFYMRGDFNTDGNIDILDLVYNKLDASVKHEIIKLEGDNQQSALRNLILGK